MACGLLLALLISAGEALAATPTTQVVKPGQMQGWFPLSLCQPALTCTPTGSLGFVTGPGSPPLGVGSLELATGAGDGSVEFLARSVGSAPLSDLSGLSFSSFRSTTVTYPRIQVRLMNGDSLTYLGTAGTPPGSWVSNDAFSSGSWVCTGGGCKPSGDSPSAYLAMSGDQPIAALNLYVGNFSNGAEKNGLAYVDNVRIAFGGTTDSDTTYDFEPPSARIGDRKLTEGNSGTKMARFKVVLEAASTRRVTIKYATANGTATAPSDYTAKSGAITFSPGETAKTVSVAVRGDRRREAIETFFVKLRRPTNASIADGRGKGTIVDND